MKSKRPTLKDVRELQTMLRESQMDAGALRSRVSVLERESTVALQQWRAKRINELEGELAKMTKVVKLSRSTFLGQCSSTFYLLQVGNVLNGRPVSDLNDLAAEAKALAEQ